MSKWMMNKWMIRAKFDKKLVPDGKSFLYNYKDGQYLYYSGSIFNSMKDGTLFKTQSAAKGKLTLYLSDVKDGYLSMAIVDPEIIKVKIVTVDK
jgi:hypothetical protein